MGCSRPAYSFYERPTPPRLRRSKLANLHASRASEIYFTDSSPIRREGGGYLRDRAADSARRGENRNAPAIALDYEYLRPLLLESEADRLNAQAGPARQSTAGIIF